MDLCPVIAIILLSSAPDSAAYSPKFNKIVGIAMIEKNFWAISKKFKINIDGNFVSGETCNLPIV
ncbi:hypothetical protein IDH12_03770 [Pelagibacterales bacterium SAG-MED29]|nr:hypothetical protein [Pelagibacterales bacterium SAG-MED29]